MFSHLTTFKDVSGESSIFRARLVVAAGVVLMLSLGLVVRLTQLQVFDHDHFQDLSQENRIKIVPLPPSRGVIFDRNGVVLARNTPSFSLEIVPGGMSASDMAAMIKAIADVVPISNQDIRRFYQQKALAGRFQGVPLRHNLTEEEVARFAVDRHRFPGVDVRAKLIRDYPQGTLGAHAIGYVGRIGEMDLAGPGLNPADYQGIDFIGKAGVELAYESELRGRIGHQHVKVDAAGRTLKILDSIPPVPGADLYLTLDSALQAKAEAAIAGENGAVVVMEPASGEILALVSSPGFDPNLFTRGIKAERYQLISESPHKPLFNRALSGQYPPGSTIKPFVGLGALESGVGLGQRKIRCVGWYKLKEWDYKYRDWKRSGHGLMNMDRAIAESCDVYFYDLALAFGIDGISDYLSEFGFGKETGVDLMGERPGLIPTRKWKQDTRKEPWYPGETLITGIGQGFISVTPIQLASLTGVLAMEGVRFEPRIVRRIVPSEGKAWMLEPTRIDTFPKRDAGNWRRIIRAMVASVHGPRGTARRIGRGTSYRMAGKTGTAQVVAIAQGARYEEKLLAKEHRDHALFIAFAPAEEPRIAISVIVENGGNGSRAAAPVARAVFDHYFASLTSSDALGGPLNGP